MNIPQPQLIPISIDNSTFQSRFQATYSQMADDSKWRLSSGRAVEDVIFEAAGALPTETIAHSFILNPEDSWFRDLFEDDEWTDILAYLQVEQKAQLAVQTPKSLDRIPDNVRSCSLHFSLHGTNTKLGHDHQRTSSNPLRFYPRTRRRRGVG